MKISGVIDYGLCVEGNANEDVCLNALCELAEIKNYSLLDRIKVYIPDEERFIDTVSSNALKDLTKYMNTLVVVYTGFKIGEETIETQYNVVLIGILTTVFEKGIKRITITPSTMAQQVECPLSNERLKLMSAWVLNSNATLIDPCFSLATTAFVLKYRVSEPLTSIPIDALEASVYKAHGNVYFTTREIHKSKAINAWLKARGSSKKVINTTFYPAIAKGDFNTVYPMANEVATGITIPPPQRLKSNVKPNYLPKGLVRGYARSIWAWHYVKPGQIKRHTKISD